MNILPHWLKGLYASIRWNCSFSDFNLLEREKHLLIPDSLSFLFSLILQRTFIVKVYFWFTNHFPCTRKDDCTTIDEEKSIILLRKKFILSSSKYRDGNTELQFLRNI